MKCPKCGASSGDDWGQCDDACPMLGSPHYSGYERLKYRLALPGPLPGPCGPLASGPVPPQHPTGPQTTPPRPVRPPVACDGCCHLHLLPGGGGDGKYCYHPKVVTRSVVGNHEIPCDASAVWNTQCRGEWKQ